VLGTVLAALRRGRQIWPRLLIASSFGFAVLLLDSVVGLVRYRVARAAINPAHGDQDRFVQTYTLLGIVTTLPYVIAGTFSWRSLPVTGSVKLRGAGSCSASASTR
jgi:uncharacterized membrane protein